jgi:hypothetical protein
MASREGRAAFQAGIQSERARLRELIQDTLCVRVTSVKFEADEYHGREGEAFVNLSDVLALLSEDANGA